jgi:hypothetical protein
MRRGWLTAAMALVAVAAVAGPSAARTAPEAGVSPYPPTGSMQAPQLDSLAGLYSTTSMELILLERRKGPAAALAELDRRIRKNPRLAGVCHAIAHDLGHEALTAAHGVTATALAARDDVCGGGYTHGIIEMALGSSRHPDRDLLTVCAPSQDGSCFHGVGHGLMFATGMNVGKSLSLCDHAPTAVLAGRCGEGVFMQLFSAGRPSAHTSSGLVPMTPAAAVARCDTTRMPYAANCWFYAPTVWLSDRPDDFTGAMGWCAAVKSNPGRQLCAKGVGSRTIKYHPEDPTLGAAVCAAAGSMTDSCLAGMGSYWSVHHRGRRPPSDVCHRLGDRALERRCLAVN